MTIMTSLKITKFIYFRVTQIRSNDDAKVPKRVWQNGLALHVTLFSWSKLSLTKTVSKSACANSLSCCKNWFWSLKWCCLDGLTTYHVKHISNVGWWHTSSLTKRRIVTSWSKRRNSANVAKKKSGHLSYKYVWQARVTCQNVLAYKTLIACQPFSVLHTRSPKPT